MVGVKGSPISCPSRLTPLLLFSRKKKSHIVFNRFHAPFSRWPQYRCNAWYIIRNGIRIRISHMHKYSIKILLYIHIKPFDRIPNCALHSGNIRRGIRLNNLISSIPQSSATLLQYCVNKLLKSHSIFN